MNSFDSAEKAKFFDLLFPSLYDGIVFVDADGIIKKVNPSLAAILGYEEQELLGKPFFHLTYTREEHLRFTSHNPLHRFFCAEDAGMEMTLLDRHGQACPVRFRSVLVRDREGNLSGGIGIVEKMAEAAGAENLAEKMWEAQRNFEDVLNYSADAIVICDINGNIMNANKAFADMLGYTQDEVTGRHIVEFTAFNEGTYRSTTGEDVVIDEEYVDRTGQFPTILFEQGCVNFEAHLVRKDRVLVPTDITMSVLRDKNGERRGSISIIRDITTRKIAERQIEEKTRDLQQTKDQLEKLIEASIDPIVIADGKGTILKANRAFLELLGYEEDEVIGRTMYEFSPPDGTYVSTTGERVVIDKNFYNESMEHIEQLFDKNRIVNWKTYALRKDGTVVPVVENSVIVRDENGEVTGSLGIIRDITEQTLTERELISAKDAAEAANRAKGTFLANMSHEIRTPMNGVIGFTDMLIDSGLNEEQMDYAQTIKRSGEALLSIINDILDFSKIEAGHIHIENIEFDIEMLAYDACEIVRPRLGTREVEMLCRIGDDIPALVMGDPHRFRQVLVNLLGNAAKFTDKGEIELSLDVEEEGPDYVVIHTKVRDTGIGIPKEKLETIFEMFQQADSTTSRKYGGTGLGLSICRRIAALMGGHCWAESELGKGSVFHFTAHLGKSGKKQVKRIPPVTLAGKRVLITDDNKTNLEILTHILEAAGMVVTGTTNGSEALSTVQRSVEEGRPFDVCVLDVRMPDMSGYEVARRIRTAYGRLIPLLAFTSSTEGGAQKCLESGFDGFLPKPIKRVKLYKMIERLIGETIERPQEAGTLEPRLITQHSLREDAKHSASILLAEDNPVNQKLAVTLLTKAGYTVDVAGNGKEAIEKFTAQPSRYDIIFMDIQMPELSGLEATRELRARGFTAIPIIAMTANAMKEDRERCLEAGMDDYIPKPIKREIVFEMLKKWVFERI